MIDRRLQPSLRFSGTVPGKVPGAPEQPGAPAPGGEAGTHGRLLARGEAVTLDLEGDPVPAFRGETVAVALFASGARALSRSLKYHRPRSFFCLAGHCGACLMRIDGRPNVKACQTPCSDGLRVASQNAWPSAEHDAFGVVDWLFPRGMDHHHMFTGSRAMNAVLRKVTRQMSGLGRLPDPLPGNVRPETPPMRRLAGATAPDVLVVGAGPAGLAAATAAARAGASVLCIDDGDVPGGSLLADPGHGLAAAASSVREARAAGAEVRAASPMIGFFPEDGGGLAAIRTPEALWLVQPRTTIYATGGYDQNALFEDNDRPGVISGRAAGRLLVRFGVRPARRAVVAGDAPYAAALAAELGAAGITVTRTPRVQRAHGRAWVSAATLADGSRVSCDLIAVCELPAPASEPARQHGCAVTLQPARGGFCIDTDAAGLTTVPGVFACGDVTGYQGPDAAALDGARVGAAAAAAASAARTREAATP